MASTQTKDQPDQVQAKEEKTETKVLKQTVLTELSSTLYTLSKALIQNDVQNFLKITKQLRRFKKPLKSHHLEKVWLSMYPNSKEINFSYLPDYITNYDTEDIFEAQIKLVEKHQELDIFLQLLLLVHFMKLKRINEAHALAGQLYDRAQLINKRHFDNLNSLIYYYYSRTREIKGQSLEIRDQLYNAYRTSCLRHDDMGQATILNLLLRNYLQFNHYEAAQHLVSKTTFPDSKSNNELCRFLYYTGKIKAVQQEYAESLQRLNQAVRKAPDTTAFGFRVEVQKMICIVELLLGEIPSRDIFAQADLQQPLFPYYKLVQSVLQGNLLDFNEIVNKFEKVYINDNLFHLIQRLHQSVIKQGLKKINLSYSRISFKDIQNKLNLPQNDDVEFIVAKAIRDGVLLGQIDHQNQFVVINEKKDLYSSAQPQVAYQKRINYCLNLYNSSTKAIEYPDQNYKKNVKEEDDMDPEDILGMLDGIDFD